MPRPCIVVAEIGSNHGGDPVLAEKMVKGAAESGAGWIKFQAYKTENFLHPQSPYFSELKNEELPFESYFRLTDLARRLGLKVGLTIFCPMGLALAEKAGADFIKISSGDLTHHNLIKIASKSSLPLVLSTGASNEDEVNAALSLTGNNFFALLQCTSLYPAPMDLLDLAVMKRWLEMERPAGFSDHSLGPMASQIAAGLGAAMVEKHFTIDRALKGGDNFMSAAADEFKAILNSIPSEYDSINRQKFIIDREKDIFDQEKVVIDRKKVSIDQEKFGIDQQKIIEKIMGCSEKTVKPGEEPGLIRRVAVAARNIKAGEMIDLEDVIYLRPPCRSGPFIPADARLSSLKALSDIHGGEPISLNDVEGPIS
ncbi:MAG: N-acetylneuraminate synthase family protein [Deltaproteobacteria bacterium]|jgi:sialic acid synthase SpsE|nr:N-acetylneuraminate synthase family protein [Deltaproteobacteria bacterium]